MTMQERKLLSQEILDGFGKSEPPRPDQITAADILESLEVRDSFSDVKWWAAEDSLIEKNYDNLPLFTPEAYRYYLPAYLLYSLEHFDRGNLPLEFTIYSLSPTQTSRDDPWYGERIKQFTSQEVTVIRKFLEQILADEMLYNFYESAERALRKFWISVPSQKK
jgi:hypothetical protein